MAKYKHIDKNKKFFIYGYVDKGGFLDIVEGCSIEIKKAKVIVEFLNSEKNPYSKEIEETLQSMSEMKDGSGALLTGFLDIDKFYKMLVNIDNENEIIRDIKTQSLDWKNKGSNIVMFDGFIDYSTYSTWGNN